MLDSVARFCYLFVRFLFMEETESRKRVKQDEEWEERYSRQISLENIGVAGQVDRFSIWSKIEDDSQC